jgi:TolB-like protein/Tfp pilus assembly protein PilF
MAAGERAFARPTAAETMAAILTAEPPPVAGTGKQIPFELDRLIARCLEKNPGERQQSARDLAFALREMTGSAARPVTLPGRPRRRSYAIAIAAAGAVMAAGLAFYLLSGNRGETIDTLAVLPFANAGNDPNAEYLSEGITDSITNNLSQLAGLRVTARSMVYAYKGKTVNPQQAGRDLKVRAVLTGSVEQHGDLLIIRAELVDVTNASQLWGEQFQRKLADMQAIEGEISQEISQKLRLKLTGEDRARLARRDTRNTEAYQLYLKGRYYWSRYTAGDLKTAVVWFQQAIDKDPAYARAYAGLADAYVSIGFNGYLPPKESYPPARTAATRALALDDSLSEAHVSLASVRYLHDWDWPEAEKEFKRAIELDAGYAIAHDFYSHFLMMMGRDAESLIEGGRAVALEPLSVSINARVGLRLYFGRQFDQAMVQLRKTLELDPNSPITLGCLGLVYTAKSMHPEAIEALRKVAADPGSLGAAYARAGRRAEAMAILHQLEERAKTTYVAPIGFAHLTAAMGQNDEAMRWLEKGFDERAPQLAFLKRDPAFDILRADPRFQDLLRRVGLPQ